MKIVICGSVRVNGSLMRMLATELRDAGHTVIEPFNAPFYKTHDPPEKSVNRTFYYNAIDKCDIVIVFSRNHVGFETACEVGYAIAQQKKLYFTHESNIDGVKAFLEDGTAGLYLSTKSLSEKF